MAIYATLPLPACVMHRAMQLLRYSLSLVGGPTKDLLFYCFLSGTRTPKVVDVADGFGNHGVALFLQHYLLALCMDNMDDEIRDSPDDVNRVGIGGHGGGIVSFRHFDFSESRFATFRCTNEADTKRKRQRALWVGREGEIGSTCGRIWVGATFSAPCLNPAAQ